MTVPQPFYGHPSRARMLLGPHVSAGYFVDDQVILVFAWIGRPALALCQLRRAPGAGSRGTGTPPGPAPATAGLTRVAARLAHFARLPWVSATPRDCAALVRLVCRHLVARLCVHGRSAP